jgi:hypothetical protein
MSAGPAPEDAFLSFAELLADANTPVEQHAKTCRLLTVALFGAHARGVVVGYGACAALDAALSTLLLEHRTHAFLQQKGCEALMALARCPAWRRVDPSVAAQAVIAAMSAHPRDKDAQFVGCMAIDAMGTGDPVFRNVAGACGAVEAVVAALVGHPHEAYVQRSAALATYRLTCQNASNKAKAAALGVIDALLSAMRTHVADAKLQHAACEAIGNVTMNAETHRQVAFEAGAAQAVLEAMRTHPLDCQVLQSSCRALGALLDIVDCAAAHASGFDELAADAVTAIITALGSPAAELDVRKSGCTGLCDILGASRSETSRIAESRSLARLQAIAASHGGTDAVLCAARAHAGIAALQADACYVISAVCSRVTTQQARAGAAGWVQLAVTVLNTHAAEAEARKAACALLQSVSLYDAESQLTAGAAIPAVLCMLQRSAVSAEVQALGCFTISRMTHMNETNADIAGDAAVDVALTAMRAHASVTVQRAGCSALCGVVRTERTRLHAHAAGAGLAMLAVMRAHPEDAELLSNACLAFGNMLYLVGGRDVALTLDATKAVFAALRGHPEELHMQCNVIH